MTWLCTNKSRHCVIVLWQICEFLSLIFANMLSLYAGLCFLVTYLFVFLVIKIIKQRLLLFTYHVCLFCSSIVVNIMEFDATVIPVRGLASYKTRFNPPFST